MSMPLVSSCNRSAVVAVTSLRPFLRSQGQTSLHVHFASVEILVTIILSVGSFLGWHVSPVCVAPVSDQDAIRL